MSRSEALRRLQGYLAEAGLAPGDRLPSERRMAGLIGCSRETLRAALDALEAQGRIWRHVGQGTFVGRAPPGEVARDTILIDATTPRDLMDARRMLEPQVARAAAECRETRDVALLRQRVQDGRKARDRAACERADDAFHQAIAHVTRNPVLIALLRHFSSARCRGVWQREWEHTYASVGVDEFRHLHSDQHAGIVDAIARGDGIAAQTAMASHLDTIARAMAGKGNAGRFTP
ncbi:FadR/GntR family transcriptional regulator [Pukyongiella litopenaei]|nr:FCD domain-containing protein [Pukyongiella litopenaei]